jgi:DNA-directed RNA polymerase subunit beta'
MLEINDFNAIRISLASPDDIFSWTHGEVTKPETINYRTLKPERDGLFCERIFGPTKDWECYCGKYKRVRYKGVVCDKCGVEVTRSKVRRDRMGHISLASPVSHIWFVKGTPSRIGLLLDISPRNLERVLYFAAYIIAEVNEEQRDDLRERIQQEYAEKRSFIQREDEDKRNELTRQHSQDLEAMETAQSSIRQQIEEEYRLAIKTLDEEYQRMHDELEDLVGKKSDEDVQFRSELLVEEGEGIDESVLDRLEDALEREKDTLEVNLNRDINNAELVADANRERKEHEVSQAQERFQENQQREIDVLISEEKDKLEQLESLKIRRVLSENEYRVLRELAPGVFQADMGAGAIREIVSQIDLDGLANQLQEEILNSTGQRRKRATKRLRVVEKFRKSGNKPEWMILTVLPVIPPDLRPMVQLDGGRFATSDLNDLYRRVINRNNRLKRLMELNAPEIIVRNEKRMLQEAVDALIDNGRRGRAVSGKGKHRLKSLSDMLKGKQGRFRQNLLGKRVDYSGRSVIVVGPDLQLHQCGLPKKMALELFKPFVMRRLVEKGFAHNIKSAKRIVERVRPEVWDVLEEVIKDYKVLLNRAPSLHRLSIQAFEAKLIEGSAIQLHPLVCAAFNADFDGDQMAVHVPLSLKAQKEARTRMLSTYNLLSPAHGEPIITPSQDIVLGCYYLTMVKESEEDARFWRGKKFESPDEALMAYDKGLVAIQDVITVIMDEDYLRTFDHVDYARYHSQININALEGMHYWSSMDEYGSFDVDKVVHGRDLKYKSIVRDGTHAILIETTVGRIIFNHALLPPLRYRNELVAKKGLKEIIAECYRYYTNPKNIPPHSMEHIYEHHSDRSDQDATRLTEQELARLFGSEMTAMQADMIKRLGFKHATSGGMTIGINDIQVPQAKYEIVSDAEQKVNNVEKQFRRGLITADERYRNVVDIWQEVTKEVREKVRENLNPFGPVAMMAISGARGNINQISQMAGMRGLMSDPTGRIIELPIKANFREGLSVLEYFVSTHGGRKGLADTALRTADAGYLTRRLVDVAQDVIVTLDDCGTEEGIWLHQADDDEVMEPLSRRVIGRIAARPVAHPETGEILIEKDDEIDEEMGNYLVNVCGFDSIYIRSTLSCQSEHGICRMCYGRNLATGKLVEVGEAVGIIAAQSIGEPGTQLTLRTFHTGGVASADDITQGLPRVQEIFEARTPKGKSLLAEIDGIASIEKDEEGVRKVRITATDVYTDEYIIPSGYDILVADGVEVAEGELLAESNLSESEEPPVRARMSGLLRVYDGRMVISMKDPDERELVIPHTSRMSIEDGDRVIAGQKLTDGSSDPQELLAFQGKEAVQRYLVNEAQKVYRSQGVNINDKHVEVIVSQMLRRVRIEEPGDTGWLPNELVEVFEFKRLNEEVLSEGGDPAIAATVLLGITKASLNTDSFLSAASFQETTRVLTEAAINGSVDYLRGLKENVVIGKLIPAGTGIEKHLRNRQRELPGDIARILANGGSVVEEKPASDEPFTLESEVQHARTMLGDDGEEKAESDVDEQVQQARALLGMGLSDEDTSSDDLDLDPEAILGSEQQRSSDVDPELVEAFRALLSSGSKRDGENHPDILSDQNTGEGQGSGEDQDTGEGQDEGSDS